ncbi:MAG: DNA polymerase IV [Fimbriimonadaceae bacterium]|nr:DNA polymerase IV [Fimbriimonadaceae bacterium]
MRYYLHISLHRFFALALASRQPSLKGSPFVIDADGTVLDLSLEAEIQGVRKGMGLSEARSILPEVRVISYVAAEYEEARATWLDACLLFSNVIEPGEPDEAWIDLTGHPDPAWIAEELVCEVRRASGCLVRAAIAPRKWVARLASSISQPVIGLAEPEINEIAEVFGESGWTKATLKERKGGGFGRAMRRFEASLPVISDVFAFLDPIPTRHLEPVALTHRARLEFLGFRTIGQVARASVAVLRRHFGVEGTAIREAAMGGASDAVRAIYPPDSVSVKRTFEGGCRDAVVLDSALRETAARLACELSERDRVGADLIGVIESETGRIRLQRRMAKPMQAAAPLFRAMQQMMLGQEENWSEGIWGWRWTMPGLQPTKRRQVAFRTMPNVPDKQARAEQAMGGLNAAYGPNRVLRAADVPETRRQRVLRIWGESNGWF